MSNWKEKLNQAAQTTISKGKEVAGIAKLNVEITTLNQSMKSIYTEVGRYVMENGLLSEDETVAQWASKVADMEAEIEDDKEQIRILKNATICSGCGAEVSRSSKFCDKCGTPIVVASTDPVKEDEDIIDADYSEAPQEAGGEQEAKAEGETEAAQEPEA